MPTENDFLPFAAGGGANVITQAAYAASAALSTGFQSGVAASNQLNKVWRQSSIIAALMGQFIADYSGQAAIDDGTISTLEANLLAALGAVIQPKLGNYRSLINAPSTYSITAADMGKTIVETGAGFSLSLPTAASVPAGASVRIACSINGSLFTSGADTMTVGAGFSYTNIVTTLPLYGGDVTAVSDGVSTWWVTGSNTLKYVGGFQGLLASSGYQKLPTGTIIQYGSGVTSGGAATVTFPLSFPSVCRSIVVQETGANGWSTTSMFVYGSSVITTTGCTIKSLHWNGSGFDATTAGNFNWIAIGQ